MVDKNTESEFISIPEAAKRVGLSRKHVFEFVKDGRLPAQQAGRFYIIRVSDVDTLKSQRTQHEENRQTAESKSRLGSKMKEEIPEQISYLPLYQTLAGGFLTFIGGLIGTYLTQRSQKKSERESLMSAFYGEITALLSIIKRRGYFQGIVDDLNYIEKTGEVRLSYFSFTQDFAKVYEENIGKIGLLPAPLPEKIVKFYTFLSAALEDFKGVANSEFDKLTVPEVKELLKELIEISSSTLRLGEELQGLLKND